MDGVNAEVGKEEGILVPHVWTVISKSVILTASLCLSHLLSGEKEYRLVMGCRDVMDEYDNHCQRIVINISHVVRHPKWNPSTYLNDVAVIKLPMKVQYRYDSKHAVIPICLPTPDFDWKDHYNEFGFVAGWGQTEESKMSDDLNTVALRIQEPHVCKDMYDPQRSHPETGFNEKLDICAAGEVGHDSCAGDSGGPLMYKSKNYNNMIMIGITSFSNGKYAQEKKSPGAYTDITRYLDWLKQFF